MVRACNEREDIPSRLCLFAHCNKLNETVDPHFDCSGFGQCLAEKRGVK